MCQQKQEQDWMDVWWNGKDGRIQDRERKKKTGYGSVHPTFLLSSSSVKRMYLIWEVLLTTWFPSTGLSIWTSPTLPKISVGQYAVLCLQSLKQTSGWTLSILAHLYMYIHYHVSPLINRFHSMFNVNHQTLLANAFLQNNISIHC